MYFPRGTSVCCGGFLTGTLILDVPNVKKKLFKTIESEPLVESMVWCMSAALSLKHLTHNMFRTWSDVKKVADCIGGSGGGAPASGVHAPSYEAHGKSWIRHWIVCGLHSIGFSNGVCQRHSHLICQWFGATTVITFSRLYFRNNK